MILPFCRKIVDFSLFKSLFIDLYRYTHLNPIYKVPKFLTIVKMILNYQCLNHLYFNIIYIYISEPSSLLNSNSTWRCLSCHCSPSQTSSSNLQHSLYSSLSNTSSADHSSCHGHSLLPAVSQCSTDSIESSSSRNNISSYTNDSSSQNESCDSCEQSFSNSLNGRYVEESSSLIAADCSTSTVSSISSIAAVLTCSSASSWSKQSCIQSFSRKDINNFFLNLMILNLLHTHFMNTPE